MRYLIMVFWIIIFLLVVTFTALNSELVTVNYYLGTRTLPLPVLLFGTLCFGGMLALSAMFLRLWKLRRQLRCCQKQIRRQTKEINDLRRAPIQKTH